MRTFLVPLCALMLLIGCQSDQEKASERLTEALTLLESAPDSAHALLGEAVTLDPTLERAHRELGQIAFSRGEFDQAIAHATSSLDLTETAEARAVRGRAHLSKEQWEPALADLSRSWDIDMTQNDLHRPIGIAQRRLERTEEATAAFERALEADAEDEEASVELAELLVDQASEQIAQEAERVERAEESTPDGVSPTIALNTEIEELLVRAEGLAPDGAQPATEESEGDGFQERWSALEARIRDERQRRRPLAVLGVLSAGSGAFASPDNPFGSDASPETGILGALGSLTGDRVGENFGLGGLGLRDGGGTDEGTIGLGNLGSIDMGSSGPSSGARRADTPVPRVRMGTPQTRGSLDVHIVRRVLRRHLAQARFCYQQALARNSSLSGTVTLNFVVDPNGSVQAPTANTGDPALSPISRCLTNAVRRWTFPSPPDGRQVVVNQPYTFSTSS